MTTSSTDLALPSDMETGLEDFDPNEAALPRLTIVQDSGVFKDSLSNEEFSTIIGVPLGLIKQRTMWDREVQEGAKPQCKSQDAEHGYPNVTGPQDSLFPWEQSGTTRAEAETDEYGRPILKCETCPFSEWVRKGTKNTPPRCSERYTIPFRYTSDNSNTDVHVSDLTESGIISFQRSGITPAKNYISSFVRAKTALFTKFVQITLRMEKKGNVDYSVPVFKALGGVPQDEWENFVKEYRGLREFLRRDPRPAEDAVATEAKADPIAGRTTAPVQQSAPNSTPASRVIDSVAVPASTSAVVDDDDLPF